MELIIWIFWLSGFCIGFGLRGIIESLSESPRRMKGEGNE